ncbi:hypothetical protein [Campylobacter hyointestinalis]|uniref:hypothetical protein n=1 Tax=Campylobacter hyointestinalis TaxID=198 RepID=UPI0015EBB3F2|nr:hypothetical protein [Campylobacter hyointestinalis]
MANDILKIRDIGAKEVSKRTHIEAEYLEYMCDKNFDKLKKLNAIGFVKILSREYDWDLSDWTEEFKAYCLEHPEEGDPVFCVAPKIPAYTSTNSSNSGSWILAVAFVVIICGFIWLFGFTKYFDDIGSFFDDKNKSVTYSNSPVVEDAKENLKIETNITIPFDEKIIDANITDINESQSSQMNEVSTEQVTTQTEDNITSSQVDDILKISRSNLFATINPRKSVWIGIKYLDTNEKSSKTTNKPFEIDLSRNAIVVAGHGDITLELSDQNRSYNSKNSIRFLVQNGEIRQIDYDEYITINKGKEW